MIYPPYGEHRAPLDGSGRKSLQHTPHAGATLFMDLDCDLGSNKEPTLYDPFVVGASIARMRTRSPNTIFNEEPQGEARASSKGQVVKLAST